MPWTSEYQPEGNYVLDIFTGKCTREDIEEITTVGIKIAQENNTDRYLLDCRKMIVEASMTTFVELPEKQYIREDLKKSSKLALILPEHKPSLKFAHFYEVATYNRGWNVESFNDFDDGKKWLLSA